MSLTIRRTLERFLAPDRANFVCHLVEGVFASFGMGVASGVILQLVVLKLGYSAAAFGFLASLGMVGMLFQVLVAPNVEAARRKKRLVLLLDSIYSLGFLTGAVLCLASILSLEHCRVDESDVEDLRTDPAAEESEKGTDHD